jgi:GntR family transcriptional regulator
MLNHQSPVPLYHQLAEILTEKIRSGEYPAGSRIPSEHQLAAEYGIGRPTARQATDVLVRNRALARKRGAGTFVLGRSEEVDLFSLAGTSASFQAKGISVSAKLLKKIQLKKTGGGPENPFTGQKAYFFSRLQKVGDLPVVVEDIWLHPDLFKGIDRIFDETMSLSQLVVEHYYMKPTGGKQNFRIVFPDKAKAAALSIPTGEPILEVQRFIHFPQSKSALYSELFCRTDQFVFSQKLGGFPHA